LKEIKLGTIKTRIVDDFLIIAFSRKWLSLNCEKEIEFDAKVTKEGQLVLSACLARLDRTNEVDDNEM